MIRTFRSILLALTVAVLLIPVLAAVQSHSSPVSGPLVLLKTTKGPILIKLYPKDAPITCANFIGLVKQKFYNGLKFHRVTDLAQGGLAHIAQIGDPRSRYLPADDPSLGMNGSAHTIKGEFVANSAGNPLLHNPGAVAMARLNGQPDSATSQFYICTTAAHELDGQYAVFGFVIKGLDNAKRLVVGDRIITATVIRR